MCIFEGCKKRAYFNKEGETKGLFCGTHRKEGMKDVKSKKCIHENCKKQPYFNKECETKGLYWSRETIQKGRVGATLTCLGRNHRVLDHSSHR